MKKIFSFLFHKKSMNQVYPHATTFQVFKYYAWFVLFRNYALCMLTLAAFSAVGFGAYQVRGMVDPKIVYAEKVVEVATSEFPPVLERIIYCESKGKHLDPKTGQVYMLPNDNGTVDIGVMMINSYYWGKTAKDMGYDLTDEGDNRAFGQWLFMNNGSEPWVHSKHCWKK